MRTFLLYWFGLGSIGMFLLWRMSIHGRAPWHPVIGTPAAIIAGGFFGPVNLLFLLFSIIDPVSVGMALQMERPKRTRKEIIQAYLFACLVLGFEAWTFIIQSLWFKVW